VTDPRAATRTCARSSRRSRANAPSARRTWPTTSRPRFGLRPGLTEAEAADILWALTAPEPADRFIRRRGWTLDRYEHWLAHAMADALVGP
jgi:hypothetical protein